MLCGRLGRLGTAAAVGWASRVPRFSGQVSPSGGTGHCTEQLSRTLNYSPQPGNVIEQVPWPVYPQQLA